MPMKHSLTLGCACTIFLMVAPDGAPAEESDLSLANVRKNGIADRVFSLGYNKEGHFAFAYILSNEGESDDTTVHLEVVNLVTDKSLGSRQFETELNSRRPDPFANDTLWTTEISRFLAKYLPSGHEQKVMPIDPTQWGPNGVEFAVSKRAYRLFVRVIRCSNPKHQGFEDNKQPCKVILADDKEEYPDDVPAEEQPETVDISQLTLSLKDRGTKGISQPYTATPVGLGASIDTNEDLPFAGGFVLQQIQRGVFFCWRTCFHEGDIYKCGMHAVGAHMQKGFRKAQRP